MRVRCIKCEGIGHLFTYKAVPMYGNKIERFWKSFCNCCNGSGYVTLAIDSKQRSSGDIEDSSDFMLALSLHFISFYV